MTTAKNPVGFDPFSDEYFNDPTEMYRRLRDEAPVWFSEKYGFYALSRFADVLAAHRDWEGFSSAHGIELFSLSMDPEEIASLSADHHDGPAGARPLPCVGQPGLHAPGRHLARTDDPGGHLRLPRPVERGRPFDAVADFTAPFPVEVISRMLGVPEGERQRLRHWLDASLDRSRRPDRTEPREPEAIHNIGIVLALAHGGEAQASERRHAVAPHPSDGRSRRR